MGNDMTNLLPISSKTTKSVNYPEKNKEIIVGLGSENILDSCGELEEFSPFSKYGIKYLQIISKSYVLHKPHISSPIDKNEIIIDNFVIPGPKFTEASDHKFKVQENEIKRAEVTESVSNLKNSQIKRLSDLKKEFDFMDIKITGKSFLKIRFEPICSQYQMLNKIGEGAFGSVLRGKCLKTGEIRAIKILKKRIMKESDQKSLMAEINILTKMDHIRIIKLYDIFYHKNFFYVVTEYCEGGTLNVIEHKKFNSEKEVAIIMKQIMSALNYMHKMSIAHRDLKLENVVFLKENPHLNIKNCLKLIDFGLACEVENKFDNPSELTGTLSYMAPEIFDGSFSCQSDVWSCGIILCHLLTKCNPFKRGKSEQTKNAIQKLVLDFNSLTFSKISENAKGLLSCMLEKNPMKRITIEQALNHEWIKSLTNNEHGEQIKNLDFCVINNFSNFHRGNNFICFIKNYLISTQLTQCERQELAQIYESIDLDSSGMIEKEELIELYSRVTGGTDQEIEAIIQKIDQNQSGQIDFQEFLLCMTNNQIMHNRKYISQAFEYLDKDHTGFIEEKELLDCLEGCEVNEISKIFEEFDFNKDGKIEKDEFESYLLSIKF